MVSIRSIHGLATTNATPSELTADAWLWPTSRVDMAASHELSYTVGGVPFPYRCSVVVLFISCWWEIYASSASESDTVTF